MPTSNAQAARNAAENGDMMARQHDKATGKRHHAKKTATSAAAPEPESATPSTTLTVTRPREIVAYRVTVSGRADLADLRALLRGIETDGSDWINPKKTLKLVRTTELDSIKDELDNSKYGCFPKGYPTTPLETAA